MSVTWDAPWRLRQIDTSKFPKEYPARRMISEQDEDWIVEAITKKLAYKANLLDEEASNIPITDPEHTAKAHEAKGIRKAALIISSGEWKQ